MKQLAIVLGSALMFSAAVHAQTVGGTVKEWNPIQEYDRARAEHLKIKAVHNILPPAEFDHVYIGTVRINQLQDIEHAKRHGCIGVRPVACATVYAGVCVIWMIPDDQIRANGLAPEIVLRHEMGHCNGWGADHAGARPWYPETAGR
jgi:hypothetical protein